MSIDEELGRGPASFLCSGLTLAGKARIMCRRARLSLVIVGNRIEGWDLFLISGGRDYYRQRMGIGQPLTVVEEHRAELPASWSSVITEIIATS